MGYQQVTDSFGFVSNEIIQDHDIARLKGGQQNLPDIDFKDRGSDRPSDHHGSLHAVQTQTSQECLILTVVTPLFRKGALPTRGAGIVRSHIQVSAALVNDHHAPRW
jgi:hypothetical protein